VIGSGLRITQSLENSFKRFNLVAETYEFQLLILANKRYVIKLVIVTNATKVEDTKNTLKTH
jgi:hypothetical protein